MSEISDMIQRLCPDGVEYRKLISVAKVQYGYPFDAKLFTDDDTYIPLIRIRDVKSGKSSTYYSGAIMSEYIIHNGDILVGMDGEFNLGRWKDRASLLNQRVCKIASLDSDIVLNGFLFHLLLPLFKKIEESITGSTVKHLSAKVINDIEIPVPPLEVQRKIVEILDNFSEFTADLIAELTARQKQYEYYRDNLLNFNRGGQVGDIQWYKLMDICKLSRGKVISKDYLRDNAGCYPVYSSQTANNGELGKINTYDYDGQYLTWTTDGAYAGTVFKRKGKFSITNVCGLITINSDVINYDFLYYWLSIEAPKYVYQGMGNPKLMSNVMGTISIPIPPLSEQERIVAILDRFEALTTDLTAGLPAEIKARQQQYEYYRDQLLTFKRAN